MIPLLLCGNQHIYSQLNNQQSDQFIVQLKQEITKCKIGEIEEHFREGYFKTLEESDYSEKNQMIGLTSLRTRCENKNKKEIQKEIEIFFEQLKQLKAQRKDFAKNIHNFQLVENYLKLRMYPENLRATYSNENSIIYSNISGIIEVLVFDLPTGIGSVNAKYIEVWKKTKEELYHIAKKNTLNYLTQDFVETEPLDNGYVDYYLVNKNEIFITSSILDLSKFKVPIGKYGTLISMPNNTVIVARPINKTSDLEKCALNFMDNTDLFMSFEGTKPLSNNVFWLNNNKLELIKIDYINKRLIYPKGLMK